jgi:hypothetical protein
MKPQGKSFIKYEGFGKLTIEDCLMRQKERIDGWEGREGWEGNVWNSTFIYLNKGTFIFNNVEFNNIKVKNSDCIILSNINDEKMFNISNCKFIKCESFDEGKIIEMKSESNSGNSKCYIFKSEFISCLCDNKGNGDNINGGGCVYISNTVNLIMNDCKFNECISFGKKGGGFFFFYFIFFYKIYF